MRVSLLYISQDSSLLHRQMCPSSICVSNIKFIGLLSGNYFPNGWSGCVWGVLRQFLVKLQVASTPKDSSPHSRSSKIHLMLCFQLHVELYH
jgi:hypothetical protein